jgi:hypothetical protein
MRKRKNKDEGNRKKGNRDGKEENKKRIMVIKPLIILIINLKTEQRN